MTMQQEALARATQSASVANYAAIFQGFAAKGLSEDEIKPRVNVFTYEAWHALGRQVKKGEHGVKVCTWIPMTKKNPDTGESEPIGRKPRMSTVFHVSQTEPREGYSENLWQYALEHGALDDKPISYQEAHDNATQATQREVDTHKREHQEHSANDYYSTEFTPL